MKLRHLCQNNREIKYGYIFTGVKCVTSTKHKINTKDSNKKKKKKTVRKVKRTLKIVQSQLIHIKKLYNS